MTEQKVVGYILTGGKNTRMEGRTKFFLECEGESFGQRILSSLSVLEEIYLSVNDPASYAGLGIPVVTDEIPDIGPMGGILSGLHALPGKALLVTASDVPFLSRGMAEKLLLAYNEKQCLTLSCVQGRMQPLFGIYPPSAVKVIEQLVQEKNYRMRSLAERMPVQLVDMEADCAININTPEEYDSWCRKGVKSRVGEHKL